MIKKVYMKRTGVMTKISSCLIFTAILAVPCEPSAESLDNLPPIPYAQMPLIYSANLKWPIGEFSNSLIGREVANDSDSFMGDEKFALTMLKRGGAVGRQMAEDIRIKQCTANKGKTATFGEREKMDSYCIPAIATARMLIPREYDRALFSSVGFSFDKSLITYANDCHTYGSCIKAIERIINISKNGQSLSAVSLYEFFCAAACKKYGLPNGSTFNGCGEGGSNGKKPYFLSFLSKDVIEACQIMLVQPGVANMMAQQQGLLKH